MRNWVLVLTWIAAVSVLTGCSAIGSDGAGRLGETTGPAAPAATFGCGETTVAARFEDRAVE